MSCRDCPKWQGTARSMWGDCYHVIGRITNLFKEPFLEHNVQEMVYVTMPFDPHDCKYFDPVLRKWLEGVALPKGVRRQTVKEDDIIYDELGGERIGRVKITYFQTKGDYDCGI